MSVGYVYYELVIAWSGEHYSWCFNTSKAAEEVYRELVEAFSDFRHLDTNVDNPFEEVVQVNIYSRTRGDVPTTGAPLTTKAWFEQDAFSGMVLMVNEKYEKK